MRIASAGLVVMLAWLAPSVARANPGNARGAVTRALVDQNYARALTLASRAAAASPEAAWPEYDRGVALHELGRTDEAVRAFEQVESNPTAGAFKALATFGRARALDDAGRCQDARIAYDEYAALVEPTDPAGARIATTEAHECYAHAKPDPTATAAATALISGDYAKVLQLTRASSSAEKGSPWLDYDRASALSALGRTDIAVQTFRRAETEFGGLHRWGKSLAIWGAARAYDNAGRCHLAQQVYGRYAALTRAYDPAAADMAERYSKACVAR